MRNYARKMMKKGQYAALVRWASSKFREPGYSVHLSKLIFDIVMSAEPNRAILEEVNPVPRQELIAYNQELSELKDRYCDRDGNGEVILQNGQRTFIECVEEYNKAIEALKSKYQTALDDFDEKSKDARIRANEDVSVQLPVIYAEDLDPHLTPELVGMLLC